MRMNGNFLFSVCWRNTMIIHFFLLAKKVLNIFEKQLWLEGCRSIQSKKEIHSNRKFGSHFFCKIKKPNKIFLKLKCGWWCLYFDRTDCYLIVGMFGGSMSLDCFGGFFNQMTTVKKGTVVLLSVAMLDCFDGFVEIFFGGFLDQITN